MVDKAATTAIARPSVYRWVSVGLFMLLGVSSFMAMLALGLLLPTMSEDLSMSPGQQGVLSSADSGPISWWVFLLDGGPRSSAPGR